MQTKLCFMVLEIWLWKTFGNIFKGVGTYPADPNACPKPRPPSRSDGLHVVLTVFLGLHKDISYEATSEFGKFLFSCFVVRV